MDNICALQRNLDTVERWCEKWKMRLNVNKCCFLSFTRKCKPFHSPYSLTGALLDRVEHFKYLGVLCRFIVEQAYRLRNFIKRNFKSAPTSLKEASYVTKASYITMSHRTHL